MKPSPSAASAKKSLPSTGSAMKSSPSDASAKKSLPSTAPVVMTLSPSRIHTLDPQDWDGIDYWAPAAEYDGHIISLSWNDGRPRITNIDGGPLKGGGKLRLGDWSDLEDPAGHEALHIILANIRKSAPDRVCPSCSYLLVHNCPDFKGQKHCEECCHVPTPSLTVTYNDLGSGHRTSMEALHCLANTADRKGTLYTATRLREGRRDEDKMDSVTTVPLCFTMC